jgi:ABC-type multidrug transport system ATPase subunit
MGSSGCGKTTLINCIVGIHKLDNGTISTFNESSEYRRTGYMPQETALSQNFKIKEVFWFFGTIFGLSSSEIEEKLRFLSELLKLPESERLVKNCSGGQQRRISFAVSLIHDPDLLILDEPTVGVDPLLREQIWSYLFELSRVKKVTILLSTHYIEEAKQSDQIGLMRNGVLVAEDPPEIILSMCETADMEEAFLRLSQKQENCVAETRNFKDPNNNENKKTSSQSKQLQKPSTLEGRNRRIMSALLKKHYLELTRNVG